MAASALIPALAGALGTSTATAGTIFASSAMTLAGGIASGIGQGLMKDKEMKEMEAQQLREEQRRQANYAGVGEATNFWKAEKNAPLQTSASVSGGLGRAASTPGKMKYDPNTRRIRRTD